MNCIREAATEAILKLTLREEHTNVCVCVRQQNNVFQMRKKWTDEKECSEMLHAERENEKKNVIWILVNKIQIENPHSAIVYHIHKTTIYGWATKIQEKQKGNWTNLFSLCMWESVCVYFSHELRTQIPNRTYTSCSSK